MSKRNAWLAILSLIALFCLLGAVLFGGILPVSSRAEEEELPVQAVFLGETEYTVNDASGNERGSVDKNAKDGGAIVLGPLPARRTFAKGVSLLTFSEERAATLTIPVSADAGSDLFTADYGVDASGGSSARFVFFVNGEKHSEATVGSADFHKKFEIALDGVTEIRAEVYGAEGTCVSFGDAAFYENSPNAVSMLTENVVTGGWGVPLQRNADLYGGGLEIGSARFSYGFCINSISSFDLLTGGGYRYFTAFVGIDESVAGGSGAGSVRITASALDGEGTVLRSAETPVLYGYMERYKLVLDVTGAERIRFTVGDGGDGISDDMAVIAAPAFSMTLGKNTAPLSDFELLSSSVGQGELGLDRTASGGRLEYECGGEDFSFGKGVGFSLKSASYEEYLASPDDTDTYTQATFDISSAGGAFLEGVFLLPTGGGAYAEIYADGERLGAIEELVPLDRGGAPLRVARELPENAANLEIRLIAKTAGDASEVGFVNAKVYAEGAVFGGFATKETLSADTPYPFGRDRTPFGEEIAIVSGGGTKGVSSAIAMMAGSSVTFDVTDPEADLFSCVVGLQSGHAGNAAFRVTAHFEGGEKKIWTSPAISAATSYREVSWYAGKGMTAITLEVTGDAGVVGVFGDNALTVSEYTDCERISELEWVGSESGWGTVNIDKDVMGYPIEVNGTAYEHGISMHAFNDPEKYAYVQVSLPEGLGYTVFAARIGVSKDTSNGGTAGSVKFYVQGDGRTLFASNLIRVSDDAQFILVDIAGVSDLRLMVDNGDGGYECDFAVWIDPVIARGTEFLEGYLRLDNPIDGQSVATAAENVFTVSGLLLGPEREAQIYVNGEFAATASADENTGVFSQEIVVPSAGKNTVRVTAGDLSEEVRVYLAGEAKAEDEITLSTDTVSVSAMPAVNGILVTDLSRADGYGWLSQPSFIRFPDEVRLGGENGTPFALNWQYTGVVYAEEDFVARKIDVFGIDYTGKKMTYTFSYADASGKFELRSVWTAYSDFDGPVSHKIDLDNNSGEDVYVTTADALTLGLTRPAGSAMTASYSYKGAVYQTAYGYRCDAVTDGYDMEIFSSTDYNNGYQIDAGYIPWVSLNAEGEGLNIGVMWSDCRAHVYGKGNGEVYLEAGLRPRFRTVIPAGDTYAIPECFVDAYSGSVDDGSNQMKKWLFAFNMPEVNRLDDSLPSFEFNLWELLDEERRSWRMSDKKFYEGVHQLSELGIDEITIDTYWWKDIGDWRGVHEKWQSSITYSSEFVNALGMNFSLYMQAGNGSSDHTDAMTGIGISGNPNWFATGENKIWDELCVGDEDARAFLADYLKSYYMELGLDGIRTDFGYILGYCNKEGHAHIDDRDDVGYWTSRYVYELFDEMYELYPVPTDVNEGSEAHYFKWENCNCGGTLKDFASMKRATRIQTTDAYDPINVRRSFYDASYAFPSMQLMLWMNDYMYNPDGPYPNDNYRFWSMLMGAPCPMISMPSDMPAEMYLSLANTVRIYHDWMGELVKYGDLYHILPRADGVNWDGVQYFNPDTGKGAVLAFKPDPDGTVSDTVTLKMDGLDVNATYYIWSEEGYLPFGTYTGAQLRAGLDLTIEGSYGAEIVYIMDTSAAGAAETVAKPGEFGVQAIAEDGEFRILSGGSANAQYYAFDLQRDGASVYGFLSEEEGAAENILKGLPAGEYTLTVRAYNRFGVTEAETAFTAQGSAFADAGATVSGEGGGKIVIDGERYIKGYSLDLGDVKFGASATRTATITDLDGGTLNLRMALDTSDPAQTTNVTVYGVKGGVSERLTSAQVKAGEKYVDLTVDTAGYDSLKLTAENASPDVYLQTATGYGRTGLYGGKKANEYAFEFGVQVLRNGLNETFPRAGGFAAYVDDDHFAAIYVDAYYSNIVIYERENGQASDKTVKIGMGEEFDYGAPHLIRAERDGNSFRYYVDGELIAERTMDLAPSSVALITEDAQARFDRVSRTLDGVGESLTWRQYDVGVNVWGKTVYSTKVTEGVWSRPELRLIFVLY